MCPVYLRRVLLFLAFAGALAGCGAREDTSQSKTHARESGALSMPARLARIADTADPQGNVYLNSQRAAHYAEELKHVDPDSDAGLRLRLLYAQELLLAGDTTAALRELTPIERLVHRNPTVFPPEMAYQLQDLIAIAYLRLGEQENCLQGHNPESCLMPIAGAGVHKATRGSEAALTAYLRLLQERPDDLSARWLLNLTAMTLGKWPDGVPEQWRLSPKLFQSTDTIARFHDVAAAVGLDTVGLAGGGILEDFDGDGDLDVMCSSWGLRDQMHYYENTGDGVFVDRTDAAGLTGLVSGLNMMHADYDNDGDADVLVLRGAWLGEQGLHPNSLLRNDGGGRFTDVTEQAGILSFHPTQTAAWGDYDGDGDLDLFIGNESGNQTAAFTGRTEDDLGNALIEEGVHPCELYRNNGDGTFTNVASDVGLARIGFVKGVAWGDYDNDGMPDLYLSKMAAPNVLMHNDGADESGQWHFTNVTEHAGVWEPLFSFPTWFFDYDNDGWLDLFVGGYAAGTIGEVAAGYMGRETVAESPRLYHNEGDGRFTDVTHDAKLDRVYLAMGANYGDIDNDGFPDIYVGNGTPNLRMLLPNRMLRNRGDGTFADVTTAGGFGHLQKGHGIAFGDVDNDGDQDVYEVMGGAYEGDVYPNALFLNPGSGAHWLTLRLQGRKANRAGIGARIRVDVETPSGPRTIHARAGTGGSFGGSSLQQEIGLGNATAVQQLVVTWPGSGAVDTFTEVPMDACYVVREGEPTLERSLYPAITLNTTPRPHEHHHAGAE